MSTSAPARRRTIKLLWSYLPDWVLCIGLTAGFYALDYIKGFEREFDLTDTSIQHSFTVDERVPNWLLLVYAVAVPLLALPLINIATLRSLWDWHLSCLGLILSLSLTGAVSQVVKVVVGRPRPDLIARCQPIEGAANAPVYGLVTSKICTQTDIHIMRDGFRSFPSAHSSLSFAGLGFLSFYLAGKLHLFDRRGKTHKAWFSLSPLVGAALIAISRTEDYRHHWQDVLTGSTLGLLFAFFSYRQYYPPLHSPLSHEPFSARITLEYQAAADIERGTPIPYDRYSHGDETPPVAHGLNPGTLHPQQASTSNVTLLAPRRNSIDQHSNASYEMADISMDDQAPKPRVL